MDSIKDHLYALIFCGGGGTRLWPLSTGNRPKQFLKLDDEHTLLQDTYYRAKDLIDEERIFVITTNENYKDEVIKELPLPKENILVEPLRRNTAMAAGFGACVIAKKDPQAIIVNLWSDHKVGGKTLFSKALLAGAEAAASGQFLVATGVVPQYPHTGMGYVKKGRAWGVFHGVDVFEVEKFTEKPPLEVAKKMTASGNYLWNVGLFIWRADAILEAYKRHTPQIYNSLVKISESWGKREAKSVLLKAYNSAPEISVDYAIAEKSKNFLAVEAKFDWLDIGDFSVLWEIQPKDKDGNATLQGKTANWVGVETSQSFIISDTDQLISTVGVENLVVVVTANAVLVCDKKSAQKVKALVEALKQTRKEYL